ncbi:uncharacterized protein LOC144061863 isoform X2 [Vanacampus margaritifer]
MVSTEAQPDEDTAITDCAKVDQVSTDAQPEDIAVTDQVDQVSTDAQPEDIAVTDQVDQVADVSSSSEDSSAEEYVPDSHSTSDTSYIEPVSEILKSEGIPVMSY